MHLGLPGVSLHTPPQGDPRDQPARSRAPEWSHIHAVGDVACDNSGKAYLPTPWRRVSASSTEEGSRTHCALTSYSSRSFCSSAERRCFSRSRANMSLDEGRDLRNLRRGRVDRVGAPSGKASGRGVGSAALGNAVLLWVTVVGASGKPSSFVGDLVSDTSLGDGEACN